MSLAAKALFVIERNLDGDLTLDSVAAACGVSRFHLAHAFLSTTGRTVMEYIRARRLTQAARALVLGSPRILDVAVAACYASQEAFSRAFRARFGITPEELRKRRTLDDLHLEEVFTMTKKQSVSLAQPAFSTSAQQLYVGLAAPRHRSDSAMIPAQWRDFMSGPYHRIANKLAQPPVGVTVPGDGEDEFLYVCTAQVARFGAAVEGLVELSIPPGRYVVFAHHGHVGELSQTYAAIWDDWLPSSGETPRRAASLEHHNPSFDPRTGEGGVTLWIPLA